MQLNQQQFKYQIHPTNGVSRSGGPKPNIPFDIHPNGPVYERKQATPAPKQKRGLRQRLGDLNQRMWGLDG